MKRKGVVILLVVVALIMVLLGSVAVRVSNSTRATVAARTLTINHPSEVDELQRRQLGVKVTDGIQFGGRTRGTSMPGELVVMWYGADSMTFRQEAWPEVNAFAAFLDYYLANPKFDFRNRFGPEMVHEYELPDGLHADSAQMFCGNVGRSKSSRLELCQSWGYWARYGQYLIYLELSGVHESSDQFVTIIRYIDERVSRI